MLISVVGGGPHSLDLYTQRGIQVLKEADIVISSVEGPTELCDMGIKVKKMSISQQLECITQSRENGLKHIAILASGDVGFYSIATTLKKYGFVNSSACISRLDCDEEKRSLIESGDKKLQHNAKDIVELIPGISSFQYLASQIGEGYESWILASAHGRELAVEALVSYNKKVFFLTGGKDSPNLLLEKLEKAGFEQLEVVIGERLTMEDERIIKCSLKEALNYEIKSPAVILVNNEHYVNPHYVPKDDDFIRDRVPITKEMVRNLSADLLDIEPTHTVWDVGAGTGGVSVALARRCNRGYLYATEYNEKAVELIEANRKKLGAYNIKVIHGMAPEALSELPAPDRVFIGGTKGNMEAIVKAATDKNPQVKLVITTIALESLAEAMRVVKAQKLSYEVVSLSVGKDKQVGKYTMMMGENPIFLIKCQKQPDEVAEENME